MKYRRLKMGEVKRSGDQLSQIGQNFWTKVISEIGTRVSIKDDGWKYRRPIKDK